jgi:hypothetical protein
MAGGSIVAGMRNQSRRSRAAVALVIVAAVLASCRFVGLREARNIAV